MLMQFSTPMDVRVPLLQYEVLKQFSHRFFMI
jgi:hypothetical protein